MPPVNGQDCAARWHQAETYWPLAPVVWPRRGPASGGSGHNGIAIEHGWDAFAQVPDPEVLLEDDLATSPTTRERGFERIT
jgi:hypothetical protein